MIKRLLKSMLRAAGFMFMILFFVIWLIMIPLWVLRTTDWCPMAKVVANAAWVLFWAATAAAYDVYGQEEKGGEENE